MDISIEALQQSFFGDRIFSPSCSRGTTIYVRNLSENEGEHALFAYVTGVGDFF